MVAASFDRNSIISIHALREEGDCFHISRQNKHKYFYPRPPRGGRPSFCSGSTISSRFLSTPSARRATYDVRNPLKLRQISIHALREEGDGGDEDE